MGRIGQSLEKEVVRKGFGGMIGKEGEMGGRTVNIWDLRDVSEVVDKRGKVELTSKPLAATSVQIKVPCLALQNSKKVLVRFCCFCFPCKSRTGRSM